MQAPNAAKVQLARVPAHVWVLQYDHSQCFGLGWCMDLPEPV